jgi:hypothetical protein
MTEPADLAPTAAEAPPPAAPQPAAAKPAAAAAPARALPEPEQIAAWVHGADLPVLGALFEGLPVARFDTLLLQVKKEELLPQHWQPIAEREVPEDIVFDRLAEVGGLRMRYKDQALSRRRIENLRWGWRELRGRRPSLWTVADLFTAMRRIIEHKHQVDWHEFLSAIRDVWRGLELPHGREQLEVLWACLAVIRKNTKK